MNNTKLENKLKEIISIENYFDYTLAVKAFEKQYKKSDFFKATRKPLKQVLSEARFHYLMNLDGVKEKLQGVINGLSIENLQDLVNKIAHLFETENLDILNMMEQVKDIQGK